MKKTVFALLITCAGFFSACMDTGTYGGETPNPVGKGELIPISFSVDFTKEVVPLRSSNDVVTTKKYLDYYVFNVTTGDLYKELHWVDSDGVINDSIPEGDYTFVFAAHDQSPTFERRGNKLTDGNSFDPLSFMFPLSRNTDYSGSGANVKDLFFKRFNYTVERNKENVNQVTLDRVVGKVEVILTDTIFPSDLTGFSIKFNTPNSIVLTKTAEWRESQFGDEHRYGTYPSLDFFIDSNKTPDGYLISFFAFENIDKNQNRFPLSITLTATRTIPGLVDPEPLLIAKKTITNINVERNKTVRYTGKIFDAITNPNTNPAASFTFSMDNTWGEIRNETFE